MVLNSATELIDLMLDILRLISALSDYRSRLQAEGYKKAYVGYQRQR